MNDPAIGFPQFGAELRRLRMAAGLSLAELSRVVHYSKSHLSRVEIGEKLPSSQLARACDAALGADGQLASRVALTPKKISAPRIEESAWLETSLASASGGLSIDPVTIAAFERLFAEFRRMGSVVDARLIAQTVVQQTITLTKSASSAGGADRTQLLALAARYAEYAGWTLQETGAEQDALHWTSIAVQIANENGDAVMAVQALVRRALFALYRNDAQQVIALAASAASSRSAPHWLRAQALQREAQGHALAGDRDATRRALDQAATLSAQASLPDRAMRLGSTTVPDLVAVNTAWCLTDLGDVQSAAEILDREITRIPTYARRSRARFGVRRALAHALAGNVEQACISAQEVMSDTTAIRSATVNTDVAQLSRVLRRWGNNALVRDLMPQLAAVIGADGPSHLAHRDL